MPQSQPGLAVIFSLARVARVLAVAVLATGLLTPVVRAQTPVARDSARATPQATAVDTLARPVVAGASRDTTTRRGRRARPTQPRPGTVPPVSPRRAFLSSLLLPGLGQSRLQRPTAAAVFAGVEFGAIAMLVKSTADLRDAKALRGSTVVSRYPVDSLGQPIANPPAQPAPFGEELVRSRRLHLEDWIATLVFNHLLSGAEAFVSANLWDLPAQISAQPSARGASVAMRLAW